MRRRPLSSSTGTKILIGISGLALFAFLIVHLGNNALIFGGEQFFNTFAARLSEVVLVYVFEIGLLAVFLLHVYKAVVNFLANRSARPQGYYKKEWAGPPSRKSMASTTMWISGPIILVFLVLHLIQFKFGTHYYAEYGGVRVRDLYRLEVQHFTNPLMVAFYVVSMVLIGLHLWHGVWSSLQSLGLGNSRFTPQMVNGGKALAVVITGGFVFIPLWIFFSHLFSGGAR